jgi:hypothetical protein
MEERLDIQTALEAPRQGSADTHLPELAELRTAMDADPRLARELESIQRFDAAIRAAVQQGEVPPGLETRVLAALQRDAEVPPDAEQATLFPHRDNRRAMWATLAAAASLAAAVTGAAVWSALTGGEELTLSTIREQADQWCDALVAADWRESSPPPGYPFASDVRWQWSAWQTISLPDGIGRAVAYRLPPPAVSGVRRMTLLVLKVNVGGLRRFPPQDPYKTHDRLVATWQVGDNVYVLVLQGNDLHALQSLYDQGVRTQFPSA